MKILRLKFLFIFLVVFMATSWTYAADQDTEKKSDDSSETDKEKKSDAVKEIEKKFGICEDAEINAKLKRVSDKILSTLADDEKVVEFQFKALDEDDVNAFALPDGHIFFFKGLIELTKTDDQLAGVVGHELTHVIHKHTKKITNEALPWLLGGMVAAVATDEPGAAVAGEWFAQAFAEQYGRKAEEDADEFGLKLMIRADYDPIGMLQFFSFMVEEEKRNPLLFKNYFLVHPFAGERIESQKAILRRMGYQVPDSLYVSYLQSGFEIQQEEDIHLIDIKFDDQKLFSIAGQQQEALKLRAEEITGTLDKILKKGATRFDFVLTKDGDRAWIQAKGIKLYEPTEKDIQNSELERDEFLKEIIKKIQLQLWKERVKRRI